MKRKEEQAFLDQNVVGLTKENAQQSTFLISRKETITGRPSMNSRQRGIQQKKTQRVRS